MYRKSAKLFIVIVTLLLAVRSGFGLPEQDHALNCYMCTSVTEKDCGKDISKSNTIKPMECTMKNMTKWQDSIKENSILMPYFSIFAVDYPQHDPNLKKNMACAKVDFKKNDKIVTIRSCQTARTTNVDPCTYIEGKLKGTMEFCSLCEENGCNGSMKIYPRMSQVILIVLGSFIIALIPYGDA